jgi:hypothetical protein
LWVVFFWGFFLWGCLPVKSFSCVVV